MNQKVEIKNFKCFTKATKISLGKITGLVGMNSVGKSSAIQTLLMARQIYDNAYLYRDTKIQEYHIDLNGTYGLQLGEAQTLNSSVEGEDVAVKIDDYLFVFGSSQENPLQFSVKCSYSLQELMKAKGIFAENFYYLNAERLGPRTYQSIHMKETMGCGIHGENTFHFIKQYETKKIEPERYFPLDELKKVPTVNKQIEYWMDYVIPGIELNVSEMTNLGISHLSIRQQVFDTGFMTPYNFGFGISYVLPVIVTGLLAEKESMFLVENPEAHLHPGGQSRIGFFLACMALAGVQIVVETHSEHVINGIRIAAIKYGLEPEDISINFFSADSLSGEHRVRRLELDEKMDIMEWPDGFLDQEEKDLRTLRKLRKNK